MVYIYYYIVFDFFVQMKGKRFGFLVSECLIYRRFLVVQDVWYVFFKEMKILYSQLQNDGCYFFLQWL